MIRVCASTSSSWSTPAGIATEVAPSAAKYGKQIRHAQRRGIPFVWFPGADGAPDEVKDIRSGDQATADPADWAPPPADLHQMITSTEGLTP